MWLEQSQQERVVQSGASWGAVSFELFRPQRDFGFESEQGKEPLEGSEQRSDAIRLHSERSLLDAALRMNFGEQGPSETG